LNFLVTTFRVTVYCLIEFVPSEKKVDDVVLHTMGLADWSLPMVGDGLGMPSTAIAIAVEEADKLSNRKEEKQRDFI
jgi:hypothetical protein